MKNMFRALAMCAMCLSIPAGAITLLPAGGIATEAQFHRDHSDRRDSEIRRGLARRAATSQSSEARRYRAQRRAEIRHDLRRDRHGISRHGRRCSTLDRGGRRYRVCRD